MNYDEIKTTPGDSSKGPSRHSRFMSHLASGAMINFSGTIARTVCVYLFTFLLARMLTTGELGEYFLVTTVVNYLALVATVGLGTGVVRYVALYAGEKKLDMARNTVWLGLIIGLPISLIVMIGLILFAPVLVGPLFNDSPTAANGIRVFAIAIPFLVATQIFISATQGMHRMQYQVYSRDIGEQISKLGLSGAVLAMGAGLIGVIGATLLSVIIAFLMALIFALSVIPKRQESSESSITKHGRNLVIYSMPIAVASVFVAIDLRADILLLGLLGTSADVGLYGIAMKVAIFGGKINLAFAPVFAPVISDLWNQKKDLDLKKLFKTVSRWIFMLSFPVFLILLLFNVQIMDLFGSEYIVASNVLVVLVLCKIFSHSTGPTGLMILMSGRSKLDMLNVGLSLITDVVLCILLIPQFGIMGAAIAKATSLTLLELMRFLEVFVLMGLSAYNVGYLKPLFAGAISATAVGIIARFIIVEVNFIELLILVALMGITYLIMMLIFGVSGEDKETLKVLKDKLGWPGNARSCEGGS